MPGFEGYTAATALSNDDLLLTLDDPAGSKLTKKVSASLLRAYANAGLLVNAKDPSYGATGDGTTDDSVAIQAALDQAGTTFNVAAQAGVTGAIVYLPKGFYRATDLSVPPNVNLVGAGYGPTVLRANGNNPLLNVSDFCSVSNMWLHGDSRNIDIVYVDRAARVTLDHLYVTNSAGNGIVFEGTDGTNSAHANYVTELYMLDITGVGVFCRGDYVYDQQFQNIFIARAGIGLQLESGAVQVSDFHIWECTSHGIYVNGGRICRFTNGYTETNAGAGAVVNSRGASFVNVDFYRNTGGGAVMDGSDRSIFSACQFRDNTGPGLTLTNHLYAIVTGSRFFDVQATKTQTYAIVSTGASDYLRADGNEMQASFHVTGSTSLVGTHNQIAPTNLIDTNRTVHPATYAASQPTTVALTRDAGQTGDLVFESRSGGTDLARFILRLGNGAESGSNAGSDFSLEARDDSGASLGTVLSVLRSSRSVTLFAPVKLASASGSQLRSGSGSPEGVATAPVASVYLRTDGGANTSLYVKETGTGNTGWVPYGSAGLLAANNLSDVASPATSRANLNVDKRTAVADAAYTILATDVVVELTSITVPRTFTLPAASALNPGQRIYVKDVSGSVTATNSLSVARAGSDTIDGQTSITLTSARSFVTLESDGTSKWSIVSRSLFVDRQVFTANGTWTKPWWADANATTTIDIVGGGGGGGSGRRGAAGSVRCGGGGGGGGGRTVEVFPTADLPATLTFTVGTAGTAGAAQTVDSTDGAAGGTGGNSTLTGTGVSLLAQGGTGGSGGTASSGTGGTAPGTVQGAAVGGNASATGGVGVAGNFGALGGSGGAAGGGITSGDAVSNGGAGRASFYWGGGTGGSAGTSPGGAGGNATAPTNTYASGVSGGSGASSITGAGGSAGTSAGHGAGGSGGGASLNGNNSGAGAAGVAGLCVITTHG